MSCFKPFSSSCDVQVKDDALNKTHSKGEHLTIGSSSWFSDVYLIAFALYSLARAASKLAVGEKLPLDIESVTLAFQIPCLLLVAICAVRTFLELKFRGRAISIAISLIVGVTSLISHSYYLVWGLLFVIGNRCGRIHSLLKVVIATNFSVLLIGVMLYVGGLTDPVYVYRGAAIRHSFGFIHPNLFGQTVLVAWLAWLSHRWGKATWCEMCASLPIAAGIYLATYSRTAAAGVIFCTLLYVLLSKCGYLKDFLVSRKSALMTAALVALLAVLSVSCMLAYSPENPCLRLINSLLSGRLYYPHELVEVVGIRPFGYNIFQSADIFPSSMIMDGQVPVDNMYCRLLIYWGPFVFLLVLILLFIGLARLGSQSDSERKAISIYGVIATSLLGLAEAGYLDIGVNFFILVMTAPVTSPLLINNSSEAPHPKAKNVDSKVQAQD